MFENTRFGLPITSELVCINCSIGDIIILALDISFLLLTPLFKWCGKPIK